MTAAARAGAPSLDGVSGVTQDSSQPNQSVTCDPDENDRCHRGLTLEPIAPHSTIPDDPPPIDPQRPGYATYDDWVCIEGKRRRPGLYWHGTSNGKGGAEPKSVDDWICSPIHAVAMTADEHGASHGLLLRFQSARCQWREWAAPMHLLKGGGEEIRGQLLDQGLRIAPTHQRKLSEWMMQQYPTEQITAAVKTGWHGDAFVLPDQTIGSTSVRYQSELSGTTTYRRKGSLDGWKEHVASACAGNPLLILAVSVALCGPLLRKAKLLELGGAGIHLIGDSSRGKTTALQVAGSVWSCPRFVRTWRATSNGLEATAAMLNDAALLLDEISECDPREIGAIVYSLANGCGKQRANRVGAARDPSQWRIMLLSSGERSLSAHMAEANQRTKAGQEARFLDIPATDREFGLFDHIGDHADGGRFADALKNATGSQYGYAGLEFIRKLIEETGDLPGQYADLVKMRAFKGSDGLEDRAAGWFALIGMAGELATGYDITGWDEGWSMSAAADAYKVWRSHRGQGQTEDRQILNAIREFIAAYGDSRFSPVGADTERILNRAGWWRDGEGGRSYFFTSGGLKAAAPGFDTKRITDALDRASWIAERDPKKRSKRIRVNGNQERLYVIRPKEEDGL